jgi:hypothetical protein
LFKQSATLTIPPYLTGPDLAPSAPCKAPTGFPGASQGFSWPRRNEAGAGTDMSAAKCRYTSGSWNAGRAAGCDAGAERCAGQSGEGGRDHAHEVRRGQQDRRSLRCAARCRRHDAGERYGTAPNGRAAAGHLAESRSLSASVGRSCSFRIGPGRSIRRPQHGGLRLSAVLMSILDRPKKKSAQMLRTIIGHLEQCRFRCVIGYQCR